MTDEPEKKPCTPCQQAATVALQKLCESSKDPEQCALISAKVKSGEMKPEEFMAFIRENLTPEQVKAAVSEAAEAAKKSQGGTTA